MQYTFGQNVLVHSDRTPLESILKKPLPSAPRRLQGMMMRLQRYDITVGYEHSTNMFLADLLSREYLPKDAEPESQKFESLNMASYVPISNETRRDQTRTQRDESLRG